MKIDKIKVSIGRTINLGNYESAKVEVGMEAEIDGVDVTDKLNLLYEEAKAQLYIKIDSEDY